MVLVSDKPSNDIGILQTQLSNREGHKTRRVGAETMPLDQPLDRRPGACETSVAILPPAGHDLLAVTAEPQPRPPRLDQPPVLPRAALTQCAGPGSPRRGLEGRVPHDQQALLTLAHAPLQGVRRDLGGGTRPGDDPALGVQQPAPGPSATPAVLGAAGAAARLRAPARAPGVDPLDAGGVQAPEHGRGGQTDWRPGRRGPEEAPAACPCGSVGKPRTRVARQPAVERPGPPPLRAGNHPKGPTSLSQRWAWGGGGMGRVGASTSSNNAVINSRGIRCFSMDGRASCS